MNVVLGYGHDVTGNHGRHAAPFTKAVSVPLTMLLWVADYAFYCHIKYPKQAAISKNAGRFFKEANGAGLFKLRGGKEVAKQCEKITTSGIPVMAHLGLTPQSIHQLGGYKVAGK